MHVCRPSLADMQKFLGVTKSTIRCIPKEKKKEKCTSELNTIKRSDRPFETAVVDEGRILSLVKRKTSS